MMRVVRQTETTLERQVWKSVCIDSLAAKNPTGCLNLKIEWGASKNPALEARGKPRIKEKDRNQERKRYQGPNGEEGGGDRVQRLEEGEDVSILPKNPKKRRTRSPAWKQDVAEQRTKTATGANTPVQEKVKRI